MSTSEVGSRSARAATRQDISPFSSRDLAHLKKVGAEHDAKPGTRIIAAGGTVSLIYVVGSGEVQLLAVSPAGRRVLQVVRKGGVIGDPPLPRHVHALRCHRQQTCARMRPGLCLGPAGSRSAGSSPSCASAGSSLRRTAESSSTTLTVSKTPPDQRCRAEPVRVLEGSDRPLRRPTQLRSGSSAEPPHQHRVDEEHADELPCDAGVGARKQLLGEPASVADPLLGRRRLPHA